MSQLSFSNTIRVPLVLLDAREIQRLMDFFTISIEVNGEFHTDEYGQLILDQNGNPIKDYKHHYYYSISDTHIVLPKYSDINKILGRPVIQYTLENRPRVSDVDFSDIDHGIQLRNEKQEECVKFFDESVGKDMLVCLSTGSGKTILSIRHFLVNNLKPMIFCHNTTIMGQWEATCIRLGIPKEDIGIIRGKFRPRALANKRVYIVSSPTAEAAINGGDDKLVEFVTNMRSLECDLMIVDEAHKLFSTVSKVSFFLDFHQKLFLTATPVRSLDAENTLVRHVLPVCNSLTIVDYEQDVEVVFMEFDSSIKQGELYYISTMDKYRFNNNMYVEYMLRKPENTYFRLVDYVRRRILSGLKDSNDTNKVLISGSTIKQLEHFHKQFSEHYPELKIKKFYGPDKDLPENKPVTGDDTDIILCVSKSIDAGFDVEDLTVLINLEYVKSESLIIQLKGRLARTYEGKKRAVYVSMMDLAIPFLKDKRYSDIRGVIEKENKSTIYTIQSGISLPQNISKKKK